MDQHLVSTMGFKRASHDWGIYTSKKDGAYLVVYVDDLLIAAPTTDIISRIKKELAGKWEMKDLGTPKFLLGIEIIRRQQVIELRQTAYVDMILERFGMKDCKETNTPLEPHLKLEPEGDPCREGVQRYQQLVGSLMWAAMTTRPDLAYAISVLSRLCSNPTEQAWQAGIRVLRYLKGTRTHGLCLGGDDKWRPGALEAWSDADWGGDLSDRRSTSGYVLKLYGSAVSWGTVKQKTVALSTAEAEYYALTEAIKDIIWVRSMLLDFGVLPERAVTIHCDNQSAIALAKNPGHHRSSKHIDLRYHFIREQVAEGLISLEYVETTRQVADIFTKSLAGVTHWAHTKALGVRNEQRTSAGTILVAVQRSKEDKKTKGRPDEKTKCFKCGMKGHRKISCTKSTAASIKPTATTSVKGKTLAQRMGQGAQRTEGGTERKTLAERMVLEDGRNKGPGDD